jgi:Cys-rich protein (TIGR01571 family)
VFRFSFDIYDSNSTIQCFVSALAYMIPIVQLVAAVSIRGQVRTMKSIPGSTFGDLIIILFCPFCALVQEANEARGDYLLSQSIARE